MTTQDEGGRIKGEITKQGTNGGSQQAKPPRRINTLQARTNQGEGEIDQKLNQEKGDEEGQPIVIILRKKEMKTNNTPTTNNRTRTRRRRGRRRVRGSSNRRGIRGRRGISHRRSGRGSGAARQPRARPRGGSTKPISQAMTPQVIFGFIFGFHIRWNGESI